MVELSVLLPVRDARPWLASALASLWRQTWRDFEVVAVDDGSTDGSGELLERAAAREPRLRVVHTPPLGLPAALQRALGLARGRLVARHDADDVSHRERFARQVALLAARPEIGVVGTRLRLFPAAATGAGMRRWAAWHNALLEHEAMRRELLIDSPLAHGTAMLRRDALEAAGGWQERGWAEDLDLWVRLFARGVRFAKLDRVLYGWRQHAASSTRTDRRYARERFQALKLAALETGLLRGAHGVTLLGVGESLARWRSALGAHVARSVEARRPAPSLVASLAAPVVLAYGAARARERWRAALDVVALRETRDYLFVA